MKLIIKQYLASLKERGELDAILPDLLSQMGMTVFSRPGRGTRQDGVDVAAVGNIDGDTEKIYLFSVKAGDLTRSTWDGNTAQSLRPSLNEILDSYIPNRLPDEHKNKPIVVCLCFGGDIQEQIRANVTGYIKENSKDNLTFEEWNGDKLSSLILGFFLRDDLLPENVRPHLRKALALLDEPNIAYKHFFRLIKSLTGQEAQDNIADITVIRQINICLWILFSWARDIGNLEAAYLSGEVAVLYSWGIAKNSLSESGKKAEEIQQTFFSILSLYQTINTAYIAKFIPHTRKLHAVSSAIYASNSLDVNLALFDVLGRLSMGGIWTYWLLEYFKDNVPENTLDTLYGYTEIAINLIRNNPALYLPIKDSQVIDISLAALLFTITNKVQYLQEWIEEITGRADFAYLTHKGYPCILDKYSELMEHPQSQEKEYFEKVTSGSVLFPMIALWASLFDNGELYENLKTLQNDHLSHCNFQLWYPDNISEENLYRNIEYHGAVLSDISLERGAKHLLDEAFGETEKKPHFKNFSAVEHGLWPLILVACRHYRYPLPVELWEFVYKATQRADSESNNGTESATENN